MRDADLYSWGNPWFRLSLIWLVVLTVLSLLVGFVVLPAVHSDFTAQGIWAGMARATPSVAVRRSRSSNAACATARRA